MRKKFKSFSNRSAGVLVHPVSLPGRFGIGDFGPEARRFLKEVAKAGQTWWQMCPLGPSGMGYSPYSTFSAFAGSPLFISLEDVVREKLLSKRDLASAPRFSKTKVEYAKVEAFKVPLLEKAYRNFSAGKNKKLFSQVRQFEKKHRSWLFSFSAFSALKEAAGGKPWWDWPAEWRNDPKKGQRAARKEFPDRMRYHAFVQFLFFDQWGKLKKEANKLGVQIIGDIPIFVSEDSADVWENRPLFQVDRQGRVSHVAGVPPDAFSETGQRWGNPLYQWSAHKKTGYQWWVDRFRLSFLLFDAVRLDHFIGFYNYWAIPVDHQTAERGRWIKAPGLDLFQTVFKKLGRRPMIAEDLGVVTPPVKALRDRLGLPGMRVLQFAFGDDPEGNNYLPHNYIPNCVAYTGTHDNDTMMGWLKAKGKAYPDSAKEYFEAERRRARAYGGTKKDKTFAWDMIRLLYRSRANLVIVPIQDWMGLDGEARLNFPGTIEGNWTWRFQWKELKGKITKDLRRLAVLSGRF